MEIFYRNHDNPSYGHSVKIASRLWEISSRSIHLQDLGSLLCWSRGPSELIYWWSVLLGLWGHECGSLRICEVSVEGSFVWSSGQFLICVGL